MGRQGTMNDYLSLLPSTLQLFARYLDSITVVPWPLWIGALFPGYLASIYFLLWFMRGSTWVVPCAYPKTSRSRPCRMRVPGEWYRCRHHNRWAQYKYGHDVIPTIRRWERFNRNGKIVEGPARGIGFIRTRPVGQTLLYHNGFVRRPWDVVKLIPHAVRATAERLRAMTLHTPTDDDTRVDEDSVLHHDIVLAENLLSVVHATRFALGTIIVAVIVTIISTLLSGISQAILQWVATLAFVLAWAATSAGIYNKRTTWLNGTCLIALKWWAFIFVPVAAVNLLFILLPTLSPTAAALG